MSINDLFFHECSIYDHTASVITNSFGEEVVTFATPASAANKCKFDLPLVGFSSGLKDFEKTQGRMTAPHLYLPISLASNYIPKIGDIVERTDSVDSQATNVRYRILHIWIVEKQHHYEAYVEEVNS